MTNPRVLAYPGLGTSAGGRLGNQLWQIASTVGLAKSRDMTPRFDPNWKYRQFYSLPENWYGSIQPGMATSPSLAVKIDIRARAYLQDLDLWSNAIPEIRAAFTPSILALDVIEKEWNTKFLHLSTPICVVHVRRGDYVTNPTGTVTSLPVDWYKRAIDTTDPASVVVFSDDIHWCKKHFDQGYTYYEGVPRSVEQDPSYLREEVFDWIDLFLMSRCANMGSFVISNSTYSAWAAYLATSYSKVIYPSRWYGSSLSYIDAESMIPLDNRWISFEVA